LRRKTDAVKLVLTSREQRAQVVMSRQKGQKLRRNSDTFYLAMEGSQAQPKADLSRTEGADVFALSQMQSSWL
jgi:hypothetical protein